MREVGVADEVQSDCNDEDDSSHGFWGRDFHVIDSEAFAHLEGATRAARSAFDTLPIRFLMEGGRVTEDNSAVEVTGTWPERWTFVRLQDLGVICAFLHDSAMTQGSGERSRQFRALRVEGWPENRAEMAPLTGSAATQHRSAADGGASRR